MEQWVKAVVTVGLCLCVNAAFAACPDGDTNGDCRVDALDLAILAGQWLSGVNEDLADPAVDLNDDGSIDFRDYALLVGQWGQVGTALSINEVLAANVSIKSDASGDFDDWIELYNSAGVAIDLAGMYLTDNLGDPTKWRFPLNDPELTTIHPGRFKLIWADDENGSDELHANFKLATQGEALGLYDVDGETLIDSLVFSQQTPDMSVGRHPDGEGDVRSFGEPSPGRGNVQGFLGFVADVSFSHERGFYGDPFTLVITCDTPETEIRYTFNGAPPREQSGRRTATLGTLYTGPILIDRTQCVRAIAVRTGWKPSADQTHTYILGADEGIASLPAISLVASRGKTFYEPDGVMAIVGGVYSGTWRPTGPDSYNNPMKRGLERPVSAEWIYPDGRPGVQINAGLRVHGSDWMRPRYRRGGGVWTGDNKFAFRLYFRDQYGESRLNFPLFPLGQESFKSVVLRAGHNDRTNPFLKDELMRRLLQDMGHVSSTGDMANLFINGEYKGYFNPCEHISDSFCQDWYDSDLPWDVMTMSGIRDGTTGRWNNMMRLGANGSLVDEANYDEMASLLDVTNFVDYLVLRLWSGDWDWPQNNWSAASERSPAGRWRFFVWDAEGAMFPDRFETVFFDQMNTHPNANSSLYRALKVNPRFRQLFGDRVYRHFYNDGALTQGRMQQRFDELAETLSLVIPDMESYVRDQWIPQRLPLFLDACRAEGVYTFAGPIYRVNQQTQFGGYVPRDAQLSIVSTDEGGQIFYSVDGSEPGGRDAQTDVQWSTALPVEQEKRVTIPLAPIADAWKADLTFDDATWSVTAGGPGGVGYELGTAYESLISLDVFNDMIAYSASCYIRIPFDVDEPNRFNLMRLRMQYDDGFIAYLNGVEIARRHFLGEPSASSRAHRDQPTGDALAFELIDVAEFIPFLKTGANLLAIHGLNQKTISTNFLIRAELDLAFDVLGLLKVGPVRYTGPVPLTHSVRVKARVLKDDQYSALAEAIYAVGPVVESLRVSELMYHPDDAEDPNAAGTEYIELTNVGGDPINLNLVQFSDGIRFTFDAVDLPPGGVILVTNDINALAEAYGADLPVAGQYEGSLNDSGERLTLIDAAGEMIEAFSYEGSWYGVTDGHGFSLTVRSLGAGDIDLERRSQWRPSAYLGGSPGWDDGRDVVPHGDIVINEVLSHSHDLAPDWIELYNQSGFPVDIGGWFLSDDVTDLQKFEIPSETIMAPHDYWVFYEDHDFGDPNRSGSRVPFALSEHGEILQLYSGREGRLTGYSTQEQFGAAETGVSIGRHVKSTGTFNFVALETPTPGAANARPKVGPIVITEIMYHPVGVAAAEYVELTNITQEPIWLYSDLELEGWRLTDDPDSPGIDFRFPAFDSVVLGPNESLLVVADRLAFESVFPVDDAVRILAWGTGKLSNGGEKIQLSKPGDLDELGVRTWIRVDRVNYSDGTNGKDFSQGIDPWPGSADGLGHALHRTAPYDNYGNDPIHWEAGTPSPGVAGQL